MGVADSGAGGPGVSVSASVSAPAGTNDGDLLRRSADCLPPLPHSRHRETAGFLLPAKTHLKF